MPKLNFKFCPKYATHFKNRFFIYNFIFTGIKFHLTANGRLIKNHGSYIMYFDISFCDGYYQNYKTNSIKSPSKIQEPFT